MGCPLPTIKRLLGHSDIKMTMIYLDIDMFLIKKIIQYIILIINPTSDTNYLMV